jgi:hypothetical protein
VKPGLTAIVVAALFLAGCRSSAVQQQTLRGDLPSYSTVAAAYNARIGPLERLWARTVVRLRFTDADGKPQNEQVEGHCQYIKPSKVLVSFHKAGHPLAMLGSNQERFWWIELGNNKRAFVGTHAAATPERIAAAGLRVHPLDLMELFGLTALPESGEGCTIAASSDGKSLVATVPGTWARRRFFLDPQTFRPSRVELVDNRGNISAFAELAKYQPVALKAAPPGAARPWVATDIRVEADAGATRVIMELSDPQNDPARFRPVAFDFDRLVEANGVEQIQDLDRGGHAVLPK